MILINIQRWASTHHKQMKSTLFSVMSLSEKKAKLAKALLKKGLDSKQIKAICNYIWEDRYDSFPLVERQMTINTHNNPKEFGKILKLRYAGLEHSWAGENVVKQYGRLILGDVIFGIDRNVTYSDNGQCSDDIEQRDGDYDCAKTQVIIIRTKENNSYNRSGSESSEEWDLHVYSPGDYALDPIIMRIKEDFNF